MLFKEDEMEKTHAVAEIEKRSRLSFFKVCWLLLITILVLGMTYLWLQSQLVNAGWRVKELEKALNQIQGPLTVMEVKLARLQTPAVIKSKLEEKGIEMEAPVPSDVIHLTSLEKGRTETVAHRLPVSWGQIYCRDPYH